MTDGQGNRRDDCHIKTGIRRGTMKKREVLQKHRSMLKGAAVMTGITTFMLIAGDEKISAGTQTLPETVVNGDFETGDFTGWSTLDGSDISENKVGVVSDDATYWSTRDICQSGQFFMRGESKESEAGTIRSSSFVLGGDGYISFKIGAAAAENKGCVRVYMENGDEDILIRTYVNERWNDPKAGLTLIRVFDDLEEYIGKELYFVVENGSGSGFSFINVDDFRASMTKAEVEALQQEQLKDLEIINDVYKDYIISAYKKNGIINDIVLEKECPPEIEQYAGKIIDIAELIADNTSVIKSYSQEKVDISIDVKSISRDGEDITDELKTFLLEEGKYTVIYQLNYGEISAEKSLIINARAVDKSINDIENGGFESGDLTGWKVLNEDIWNRDSEGNFGGVISADTYWNEKLPYNQEGMYHLDGWNGWNVCDVEKEAWGNLTIK